MRDDSREAHAALEAWARWARSYLNGLGFAATNIIKRCMEYGALGHSGSFGPIPLEIDSTCEVVDRAITRLDDTERKVIYETYLRSDAAQITAQRCGLTYGYYREVLKIARRRVGDYINGAKITVV
jgi:hypothetical protein